MIRPVLARTSSAASGLRFCGMIEEPVVNLSESLISATSGEVQITISSAKRDRWTAAIAAADHVSSTKSRSATRVKRIARRPIEAERLRRRGAIDRKRGAGQSGGAQRAFVQPLAGVGK